MDDFVKLAFLVLGVMFTTMTCLGVYERRKTALESQRRERHAVARARLRMEALQDQLSRARQNTKEAAIMMIQRHYPCEWPKLERHWILKH
mmetsp:Transcript_46063/g.111577  ORF Transcript_46063/g.111577 Transcript_46063/m.111577 type:complete len:91 (+) Transcript_46063:289-561(+)